MSYIQWIRQHVGQQKIFLVYATVIAYDEHGHILLQKRTDFTWWGLPGGALELHEDILTCAQRELWEETGLRVSTLSLVGVYTDPDYDVLYPNGDEVQQFTFCLAGQVSGGVLQPDGTETTHLAFFAPTNLPADIPIWYRHMLRDFITGKMPAFCPPRTLPNTICQINQIRSAIGSDLYIGVGASALIHNEHGELLLIQQKERGCWSIPGGHSNLGENAAYTAIRETREETGVEIEIIGIAGIVSHEHIVYPNGDQTKVVGVIFRGKPTGGQLQVDHVETSQACWVKPTDMLDLSLNFSPVVWQKLHQHMVTGYFIL